MRSEPETGRTRRTGQTGRLAFSRSQASAMKPAQRNHQWYWWRSRWKEPPSEVSTNVPTKVSNKDFFSAAEPPERSQRNHWSYGKVILLNFRVKKDWRTIHEYLVLKIDYRSHLSRNLDQLSRKIRDKPGGVERCNLKRQIAALGMSKANPAAGCSWHGFPLFSSAGIRLKEFRRTHRFPAPGA